ncbi:glutamate synthase [bacterium]
MNNELLENIKNITASRERLYDGFPPNYRQEKSEEEGGCGVTGFCCTIPVAGRHIFTPSVQMHNRGNGKGGGIAAVGFDPEQLGISRDVLDSHYCLQIAVLKEECISELKKDFIDSKFDIAAGGKIDTIDNWKDLPSLEVPPPDIHRFFVRAKPDLLDKFIADNKLEKMDRSRAEDEYVFQNSVAINNKFYASLGEQQAFVISQGRNMMVLKIVGYAEDVVRYYRMEDFMAHVWIAHQRYPTRGRVWHPGGAHPFSGLDDALVHNGDFANYHSVCEYLRQRGLVPMFLTDTEVSILIFDLLSRTYGYPLEYIIEALAPTTEMDFDLLPEAKQDVYRKIQIAHIHGSPDGPWFFIIARNRKYHGDFQLLGITDTAMLRPQVFALQNGEVQTGLVCSEKQAIDATLKSLASEDPRFCPIADRYWNARGGSSSNGGSFIFTIKDDSDSPTGKRLDCTDKFGNPVETPPEQIHWNISNAPEPGTPDIPEENIAELLRDNRPGDLAALAIEKIKDWDYDALRAFCAAVKSAAASEDALTGPAIEALTLLVDLRYHTGAKKRSSVLQILHIYLHEVFNSVSSIESETATPFKLIGWDTREKVRAPKRGETTLIIDAEGFQAELADRDSKVIVDAHKLGWKKFITFNLVGQRFHGVGLGANTQGVRIDIYDSSGDYLGSGLDGLELYVHGNGQDQVGQIMKAGKLVVYGDVGQTFMYGAKGGEIYVMGDAAGRPLINGVGKPRVVINGTCLDYLAESFMAGDPLKGGGFVILNGLRCDDYGTFTPRPRPYPGSNLFSLASGGAIYLRDPESRTVEEQLNGGVFAPMTDADWRLILPYLQENEKLFGIKVEDLLTHNGEQIEPTKMYRKVGAVKLKALAAAAAPDDAAVAGKI